MSLKTKVNSISNENIDKINDDLILKIENNKYNRFAPPKSVLVYKIVNDDIFIPFTYGVKELKMKRKERKEFSSMNVDFTGSLREGQEIVKQEALKILSKNGSIMLSLCTGYGKTITSINLACDIKLKTLVVVNKIVLIKQWEEAILKVCPSADIQKLTAQSEMKDCDFYIINAINMEKKPIGFFNDIGTVIVDESHLIMAETISKCMNCVSPRYLIGLSATPYRTDGFDPLMTLYFGDEKIIRLLQRKHTVYKVKTGFVPEVELASNGKVNWGKIIDSQSNNKERNELIIDISKRFSDRNILILTKRVEQGQYLCERLKEEGENVSSLIGSQQTFDKECRILVATTQKAGTGFDFEKLDCLVLGSDVESYFIQNLGRVLRKPDVEPIVFDLVDNYKILELHFKSRMKTYKEVGGVIKNY